MKPRAYRNSLDFVKSAIAACRDSARDLVSSAKVLLDAGQHAQALSLSVLALEEMGKLCSVDGLLLAQPKDYKSDAFGKSLKSHSAKLNAVMMLPRFIEAIATIDSRYKTKPAFKQAVAIGVSDLKSRGLALMKVLSADNFQPLDKLKQEGFYTHLSGNGLVLPRDAVKSEVAIAVHGLAWRISSTIDFVLDDSSLERYMNFAAQIRREMSEVDFIFVDIESDKYLRQLFPDIDGVGAETH